jgi:hypothetical protein
MSLLIDSTAGTVGGCVGVLVGSPLDVIKTRMQAAAPAQASVFAVLRETWTRSGLRGLFRGSLASCLGQAPNNAIVFGTFGSVRRLLDGESSSGAASVANVFAAGSVAGALQAVAVAPFDGVKVQQQVSIASAPSLISVARNQLRHGVLMRGAVATIMRDTPTCGAYFASYEAVCTMWRTRDEADARCEPPVLVTLFAGGIAGLLSWSLALPLDVIKSRVQSTPPQAPTPRISDVAVALYAEAGLKGFFKGALPCILRAVPVNAVTFLVYDKCLRLLVA